MRRKRDAPREREGMKEEREKEGREKRKKGEKKNKGEEEGGFVNIELILHFWRLYVTPTRNSEIYLF
jgi:hypothetical protein